MEDIDALEDEVYRIFKIDKEWQSDKLVKAI
jgi:hypothetical protein